MKKDIYIASVDTTVVGRFTSESAAKRALTKKVITEMGGGFACGWVDRARFAIEDDMDSLHPTV